MLHPAQGGSGFAIARLGPLQIEQCHPPSQLEQQEDPGTPERYFPSAASAVLLWDIERLELLIGKDLSHWKAKDNKYK
jgi:hypothetical protein